MVTPKKIRPDASMIVSSIGLPHIHVGVTMHASQIYLRLSIESMLGQQLTNKEPIKIASSFMKK